MAKSNDNKPKEKDATLDVIQAIDELDFKECSFVQLRRLYTALMQVTANVDVELKARSEHDHEGDTVRVPVPTAKN